MLPRLPLALALAAVIVGEAAAEPGDRFTRPGIVRPLLRPGEALASGIAFDSRESRNVKGALEWTHFTGQSRLSGDRVIGVVQRWALPGNGLSPKDLLECFLDGGTVGRDGKGPRFRVAATCKGARWSRGGTPAGLFDAGTEAAIVRGENIRPPALSMLYHANAFNMLVDRRGIHASDDLAAFEGQLINPSRASGPLPGKQWGVLRMAARRLPGGFIELRKEYVAVEAKQYIAAAAPVMKPVSALMSLWNATPRLLRDYTLPGIAAKAGVAVGAALTDAVLGNSMRDLILERHGDLIHSVAVPNLREAFARRR